MKKRRNSFRAPVSRVDEAGRESFPASDPPSWTGTVSGSPRSARADKSARSSASDRRRRHSLRLKRAYQAPAADDGVRILVDRLWPRGLRKADARIDIWLKDVAPSDGLRRWFGHDAARWTEFKRRYRAELEARPDPWQRIEEARRQGAVTLLFAAHDEQHNNAVALKELLEER